MSLRSNFVPPRKILLFTEVFLPPSEAFLVEQARHLNRYRPEFLCCHRIPSKLVDKYDLEVRSLSDSTQGRVSEVLLKIPGYVTPSLRASASGYSIIHAHFGKNGYVVWPLARALGIPLLTTFHGFDAMFEGNPWSAEGLFNQKLFFKWGRNQMAHAGLKVVAVSEYTKMRLLNLGFSESNIFMNYIGVDRNVFRPDASIARVKYRVLCVSRFVEYKGHRFIVEAMSRLQSSGIPVELVLVGQGPLRDEAVAAARKVLRNVVVLDNQSQDDVLNLVRSADLFIHGSYTLPNGESEALGIALVEAQAVGTPVVAFDAGGVGEAIASGKTGFAVPQKDVNAMAEAAAGLLTNADQWRSFSEEAIKFVSRKFDIVNCTRALENTYDIVVRQSELAR